MPRPFTAYNGYRIYHPEEGDLERDKSGRYRVYAEIGELNSEDICVIAVPGCFASDYKSAVQFSIEESKKLIDSGFRPFYGA